MVVTSLLEHCPPATPLLTNIYGAIMKVLKEMNVQITLKKTPHVIDCQNRRNNANISEVQAKDVVFSKLTILNWLTGLLQTNLQNFGLVRIFNTLLFSEK